MTGNKFKLDIRQLSKESKKSFKSMIHTMLQYMLGKLSK
jgi:hypothetical protein